MKKYKYSVLSAVFYILCAYTLSTMAFQQSFSVQLTFIIVAPVFAALGLVFAILSSKHKELPWLGMVLKIIGIITLVGTIGFYALVAFMGYSYGA